MPANTPDKGYPYPLGSDRLMDGDDAIHALATSVDYSIQAGTVVVTPSAQDTDTSLTVTFPHPYAVPPIVVVAPMTGPPSANYSQAVFASNVTTTNFAARVKRSTVVGITVAWVAIGKPA